MGIAKITTRDIEAFLDLKQGGRKEVFSAIVGSKSRATRNAAMSTAGLFCEKIIESHPGIASVSGTAVLDVAAQFQLEEFLALAEAEYLKLRKTLKSRALTEITEIRRKAPGFRHGDIRQGNRREAEIPKPDILVQNVNLTL